MIEYTVQVDKDHTEWCLDGQLHREYGPAVEFSNGYKAWYLNGQLHRADGPAVELSNGDKFWYQNGIKVTQAAVMNPVKQLTVAQIEVLLGYSVKVVAG